VGGRALLAYQRGEEGDEALLGAMMIAEHQGANISWMLAWEEWAKAWARMHSRRR
jgi:hypothetical protein